MIAHLRIYFCAILFALSCAISAQQMSISGRVVDFNGSPIELATVIISVENEEDFFKGTSTDFEGIFKIENLSSSTYYLKISFIGYEDFELKIALTGQLDLKTIQLKEVPESLGEVTVIAKEPNVIRKPDRVIFNVENTALIEGSTLGVLKSAPGVIVSEGNINIKSAPATVYINNRKVQLTSEELIQLLESTPANNIKSVEVITNPPASYDADSGSVINIIMTKNLITGYRGSFATNYTQGVFPRYNAVTSHFFKNDKINLNVNYSYTNKKINRNEDYTINYLDNTNVIDEIWKSKVNRNTWSETHNLNLNLDYYIDDYNTLSITSTGLYTPYFKYQINNRTNRFGPDEDIISNFTADNLSKDKKYNIGTDLIFRHDFENEASLALNGHITLYDYDRNQDVFQDEFNDEDDSEFNTIANQDTQIFTGKIDYSLPIDESTTFESGIKYSNVKTDSNIERTNIVSGVETPSVDNSNTFIYNEKVFAAYVNYSKSWDKWELNIGLRAEQTNIDGQSITLNESNKQDYLNWFPNVSLSHQISKSVTVYGNYKRSISRPSYINLNPFTFFLNENTIVLGNPSLTPAYLDHFVIGTSFLKHFNIEAYFMKYNGAIDELPRQDNETNILEITPINLDKRIDFGFDFSFDYDPNDAWNLYFVTSFYNISEESNFIEGSVKQEQWSNFSQLTNTLSLLEDKSLNVSFLMIYGSKNLQFFELIQGRLISELSISKSIFNSKGVISLSMEDLFNKQDFSESVNYLNQMSSSFTDLDNRSIKIGFRYNFGNTKLNTNERTSTEQNRSRLKDLN